MSFALAAAGAPAAEPGLDDLRRRCGALDAPALLAAVIGNVFAGRIALVSSFGTEAAVLLDLVAAVDPATPVLFLDTGKLFAATLGYRDALTARLGLRDVRVLRPAPADLAAADAAGELWRRDADTCCRLRKVAPLAGALVGFDAWITGRKRFHGGARAALPTIEADADGRIKLNPLAHWTPRRIAAHFRARGLPPHPLEAVGYRSIGCLPCTDRASGAEAARAGRWRDRAKTECGIHGGIATPA